MKTTNLVLAIAVMVIGLATGCAQPAPPDDTTDNGVAPVWEWSVIGAYGTTDPDIGEPITEVDAERMPTHAWWNQPSMVEALDLQPDQRAAMDQVMEEFFSNWTPMSAKRTRNKERLNEAIVARDFHAARQVADEIGWTSAYFQGSPPRIKVEVLALLSDEQLQRVIDEQPFILNTKWIRSTTLKSK